MTTIEITPLLTLSDATWIRLQRLGFRALMRMDEQGHDEAMYIVPPTVQVPADPLLVESAQDNVEARQGKKRQILVDVDDFAIGTYPVTVSEYTLAVKAGAVPAPHDSLCSPPRFTWSAQQQRPDLPVVYVTWSDAYEYCRWLTTLTGNPWRLPTEAEWEKAARWDVASSHSRRYPWGDTSWPETDTERWARIGNRDQAIPIGSYAARGEASPYGVHDMACNVWEWTSTLWYNKRPPYDVSLHEQDSDATSRHVLRGGTKIFGSSYARAARRSYGGMSSRDLDRGFRVAYGPPPISIQAPIPS